MFTTNESTKQEKAEVRKYAGTVHPEGPDRAKSLPDSGIFYDWNKVDVGRWPTYFVEFWQPKNRLYVYGRRLEIRVPQIASVMSIGDWKGLRAATNIELPSAQKIAESDAALAKWFRDKDGTFFASGVDLARFITKLPPQH